MRNCEKLLNSKKWIISCCIAFFVLIILSPIVHHHASIDGGYTEWSPWSSCFATCGNSLQGRYRNCTNPRPTVYGKPCAVIGPYVETKDCKIQNCPVNGNWGEWEAWSECDKNCVEGKRSRKRSCNSPSPSDGGKVCSSEDSQMSASCPMLIPCPIDGGWSDWESWKECSVTCGTGIKERQRQCANPPPKFKGKNCGEHAHEAIECTLNCPTLSSTLAFNSSTVST